MEISKPIKLLKELKQSKFLPFFNEELIEQILKEIKDVLGKSMAELLRNPEFNRKDLKYISRMATIHKTILRHKRCILVYLANRLEKIENAFWEFGLNLPKEYIDYLNEREKIHLKKYKDIVLKYSKSLDMDLDLTKDLEPPNDIYLEVRVLKDCGDIVTSNGEFIKLTKDSSHFLKRSDVEHLILQGFLLPIQ